MYSSSAANSMDIDFWWVGGLRFWKDVGTKVLVFIGAIYFFENDKYLLGPGLRTIRGVMW